MSTVPDKVFISYSWSSPEHKAWVIELATNLERDGIEVILDDWDTTEGQDLNKFMEKMVNDSDIKRVLVISDKIYAEKADGRYGGVGTETTIASIEVYKDSDQSKFIALIAEVDDNGNAYLPTYLKGKKYIDLSSPQNFEEGYRKLIRNLYHKPENPRPERGTAPKWLMHDEKKNLSNSSTHLNILKKIADSRPNKLDNAFNQFLSAFLNDYKSYATRFESNTELDRIAFECFESMIELRDIYVEGIETYFNYADVIKVKYIINLLEDIYPLIYTRDETQSSFFESQFDHMKLFVMEIILYTVAVLIEYERYKELETLLKNHYFVIDRSSREIHGPVCIFQFHPDTLSNYMRRQNEWISPIGELLTKRTTIPKYSNAQI
ncbi:hypothetical protein A3844_30920, partial [Paenibacillus helianthi]